MAIQSFPKEKEDKLVRTGITSVYKVSSRITAVITTNGFMHIGIVGEGTVAGINIQDKSEVIRFAGELKILAEQMFIDGSK